MKKKDDLLDSDKAEWEKYLKNPKDIFDKELVEQKLFDPNLAIPEDQLTVCNIEVPSRKEIWEAARTSPETAWNSARDAMPTAEEFRALELPDFEWTTLGETIGSTTSEWGRVVSDIAGKKFDQLNNWWN